MLIDTSNRLFYVGESEDLVSRLRRGHSLIPDWDFYRYDALPVTLAPQRLQIERMLIRDIDSLLGNSALTLPVPISDFTLTNLRVDR